MFSHHGLISFARTAALSTSLLLPAAFGAFAQPSGYFATAGAPLVAPTIYSTGDAQATKSRQQASGYFATAGAPLVGATRHLAGEAAATLAKQQASGYFATAGAPLISPTTEVH